MIVSVDIPYEVLKKAVERIEQKKGICEKLPSARFMIHQDELPSIDIDSFNLSVRPAYTWFVQTLVCDKMGGKSTGVAADQCENCVLVEGKESNG